MKGFLPFSRDGTSKRRESEGHLAGSDASSSTEAKVEASRRRIHAAGDNWQRVFSLPQSPPISGLKDAFRKLALLHHPDKSDGGTGESDTMRRVITAYKKGISELKTAAAVKKASSLAKGPQVKHRSAQAYRPVPKTKAGAFARKQSTPPGKQANMTNPPRPFAVPKTSGTPSQPVPKPKPQDVPGQAAHAPKVSSWRPPGAAAAASVVRPPPPAGFPKPKPTVRPKSTLPHDAARPAPQLPKPRPVGKSASQAETVGGNGASKKRQEAESMTWLGESGEPATIDVFNALTHLTRTLLQLEAHGDREPIPEFPDLRRLRELPEGRQQEYYSKAWEDVIIADVLERAHIEIANVRPLRPLCLRQRDRRWSVALVSGEWATLENGRSPGCRISIQPKGDAMWISHHSQGWSAQLGRAEDSESGWHSTLFTDREFEARVKLVSWNLLEVRGLKTPLRRAGVQLHPGSLVMLSDRNNVVRCGIMEPDPRDPFSAAIRTSGNAFSDSPVLSAYLSSVGLTSVMHTLNAIHGVSRMSTQLSRGLLSMPPAPAGSRDKFPWLSDLVCIRELNMSQRRAVYSACRREAGFTLIWSPPGTGKSATLMGLLNALHLQDYDASQYRGIEDLALQAHCPWAVAAGRAPRLLFAAKTDMTVDSLLGRLHASGFRDRVGNSYQPWGTTLLDPSPIGNICEGIKQYDMDSSITELLSLPRGRVEMMLEEVQGELNILGEKVGKLLDELRLLREVTPLPSEWEARLPSGSRRVQFHNHATKTATWTKPAQPAPGEPSRGLLQLESTVERLGQLTQLADRWWQLTGEQNRLAGLLAEGAGAEREVRVRPALEASYADNAHVLFSTFSSSTMLARCSSKQTRPFSAVVLDEAAQAFEPDLVIPLLLSETRRCVLVGDDRQLPPTLFIPPSQQGFAARSVFARLRELGHEVHLLDTQYRMVPEISAFPNRYFYGGVLRDNMPSTMRTHFALHRVCPPVLFIDLSRANPAAVDPWKNPKEARVCIAIAQYLRREVSRVAGAATTCDLGIITPYATQQKALVNEMLRQQAEPLRPEIVRTVESYQGRTRDIIIFSALGATQADASGSPGLGFFDEERRLNVALTRARSMLVVVGHATMLQRYQAWAAFFQYLKEVPEAFQTLDSLDDLDSLFERLRSACQASRAAAQAQAPAPHADAAPVRHKRGSALKVQERPAVERPAPPQKPRARTAVDLLDGEDDLLPDARRPRLAPGVVEADSPSEDIRVVEDDYELFPELVADDYEVFPEALASPDSPHTPIIVDDADTYA